MEWITHYWIEWIFGIVAAALIWMWRRMMSKVKEERAQQEAIKEGLQALLRAQMVNDYNHYTEKGYAPIYARENFESCWKQYKNLGGNGVMTDLHEKFLKLPTR